MTVARVKKNFGFLVAGAVLLGVVINVYFEIHSTEGGREPQCQFTSTH